MGICHVAMETDTLRAFYPNTNKHLGEPWTDLQNTVQNDLHGSSVHELNGVADAVLFWMNFATHLPSSSRSTLIDDR